jgi:hypothetical protein
VLAGEAVLLPRDSVLLCPECAPAGGTRLCAEALGFLRRAGAIAPERIGDVPLPPRAARDLESAHRRLIAVHLEKELKSARVLREMRGGR